MEDNLSFVASSNASRVGDVVASNVWSDRMVAVLNDYKAVGFVAHPARVLRDGEPIYGFSMLQVTGLGGPFDAKRSKAVYCDDAVMGYVGIFMDESKWDGSDIFTIPGLGISVYVVERLGEALLRLKPKNVSIVRASEARL